MTKLLRSGFSGAWPKLAASGLVVAVAAGVLGAATAQEQRSPIQIEADQFENAPQGRVAYLRGNAVVIQDGAALRSSTLRVVYKASGDVDKIYADQRVFFSRNDERVVGDRGTLDADTNTITVVGNVTVTQGRNVLRGEELVVNTRTNASTMRGLDGRVRAVYFQDQ